MMTCMLFRIPYAFQGAIYALIVSRESSRATPKSAVKRSRSCGPNHGRLPGYELPHALDGFQRLRESLANSLQKEIGNAV
jgi:hypothetical protein